MNIKCCCCLEFRCQAQCLSKNENPETILEDAVESVNDARFNFALESLRHMIDIETQDNIIYSPHSLHKALGLAYIGSRGDTEAKLRKALKLPESFSKFDFAQVYALEKSLELARKENSSNYEYKIANRLWLSNKKKLQSCMLELFGDELCPTDFVTNPEAVRLEINQWVENITRGNIKDLLESGTVHSNTDTVLANAIYFKGFWQDKFDPKKTKLAKFYLGQDNTTPTQFMAQEGRFNYLRYKELGVDILELPYKGKDISMYILLPLVKLIDTLFDITTPSLRYDFEDNGLHQLLQRISDPSGKNAKKFRSILDKGLPALNTKILIPKFNLERTYSVMPLLIAMNEGKSIFGNSTDLSGFFADGETSVRFSRNILHRAKIELNEDGTTAAAATLIFHRTSPTYVPADHPFVYFIYDKSSRAILFAGIFRNPDKK